MMHFVLTALGVILFLAVAVFRLVFYYDWTWFYRRSDCKKIDMIPGPKPFPFFGNLLVFNVPEGELCQLFLRLCKEYGPSFRLWVLGFPEVFITDPEDVEVILSSTGHITKSWDYTLLHPWLGTGLLTSTETAMGIQIHSQSDGEAEYIKAVKRMTEVVVKRQFTPWLYKDFIYYSSPLGREQVRLLQILHGFSEQAIRERREEYKTTHKNQNGNMPRKRRRLAFLDLLIEISEKEGLLSDADIREEVDTFMFEGHDTTSVGISWAMYLLGSHPEVQEKAAEELKGIFGDSDREATYEDLQQMKYLEQVIKEALRLLPSVPAISRHLEVDVKLKNYTIPAGTQTPILPFLIHRNPEVFPNPENFNPDNFLPEKVQNRHPFAYIPFSAGPRNCIGQRFAMLEEKVVLSSVLRKLRLESLDKREDIQPLIQLVLRPKNGIRIKISPR